VPPYVSFVVLNRREFPITDTLLKLIAELFTTTFWSFPRKFWTPREQLCRGDLSVSFRQILPRSLSKSFPSQTR
jgi:hypothetical protein